MTEDEAKPYAKPIPNWIPETRTVIVCWMMVSSFLIIIMIWAKPSTGADSQLLNTLIGMYVGTGFISTINWWMGDAKGSDSNNKLQERLADTVGNGKPPEPTVVVSWWSLMEAGEKTAIEALSKTDGKIKLIYERLMSGKAEQPDIAALVAANLLTKERASNFKTA